MYARAALQYRQAADKLDEASKKPIDSDVSDYFAKKSGKWAKSAETREILRQYVLLVVDPAVQTLDELKVRQTELNTRIVAAVRMETELEEAATKIKADHPKKFE
jgi:hypothetical protein